MRSRIVTAPVVGRGGTDLRDTSYGTGSELVLETERLRIRHDGRCDSVFIS